jgi:hypothetical protein
LQRKIEEAKKARWEKNIKPLIDNIEIDLAPYQPYLLTSYELGHTGITNQSLYADDPKTLDPVVLEFKKLKRTREKELEVEKLKGTSRAESGESGGGGEIISPEGEWSKPMGKSKMMSSVGMSSYKKFNAFAKKHGIREAGNRQTFQIRLDGMDITTRNKLERA